MPLHWIQRGKRRKPALAGGRRTQAMAVLPGLPVSIRTGRAFGGMRGRAEGVRWESAVNMDIDRELIALDTCLADFVHPLHLSVQQRALAVAAGIIAGAPPADRFVVATRLEKVLVRHGLGELSKSLMETHALRLDASKASTSSMLTDSDGRFPPVDARTARRGRPPAKSDHERRPLG